MTHEKRTPAEEQSARTYYACPTCSAKFFAEVPVRECPRCGGQELLASQAVCPWIPAEEATGASPQTKQGSSTENGIV